ncbi:MAG: hypothetical protein V1810_03920 [Candidatus Beckwithbacteria bacterium]
MANTEQVRELSRNAFYSNAKAQKELTNLFGRVVASSEMDKFKEMVWSLQVEIYNGIGQGEQLQQLCRWLPEDQKEGFKVMLAKLIEPENLPVFSDKPFNEVDLQEQEARLTAGQIFSAICWLPGETVESRQAITTSATKFTESNNPGLMLGRNRGDNGEAPAWTIIINNQTDRRLEDFWRDRLKRGYEIGFKGLMCLPSLEARDSNDWVSLPMDIAPGVMKEYIRMFGDVGDLNIRNRVIDNILTYFNDKKPGEFKELIEKADFSNWSGWIKDGVNYWLKGVLKT